MIHRDGEAPAKHDKDGPLISVRSVSKRFGNVQALEDVSMSATAGSVTCLVGDNGAGKSTLVGILAGVYQPSSGEYLVDGIPASFRSPRDAMSRGIAGVHQDLAVLPLMSVWRNFFLGAEPTRGRGLLRRIDRRSADTVVRAELGRMGIALRDTGQAVGTLSGGERQSVAIARALYFGARVLILDEPTAALGVKQAGIVMQSVEHAKERGVAVILITHNPRHAYPAGDAFVVLKHGRVLGEFGKASLSLQELTELMAGGGRAPGTALGDGA